MSEDTLPPQDNPSEEPASVEITPEDRIAKLEALLAQAHDERLRALAEAENTRRRAEKQVSDSRAFAIDRFARELLPVADTLARALAAVSDDERTADGPVKTLFDGVALTQRTMLEAFDRNGLKPLGARGETFDPNQHQAVAQIPSDVPSGAVAEVFQVGYALAGRTIRPAMVAVSAGGQSRDEPAPDAGQPQSASIDIKV
ncbi:MAG: nucleotide exchange factor GrpE [Alphaproteobacteria bacterium]|nr:nucleotide exchange factor GrpE [Alphaproteobacteria bacterium]